MKRGLSGFTPNWTNISYVAIVHFVGLGVWPLYAFTSGGFHWQEASAFVLLALYSGIGVTAGYHRLLSHLSFKMHKGLRNFLIFGASAAAEGSAFTWCSDHRRHHRFQDTSKDPYNINEGFWWAHIGWLLGSPTSTDFSNSPDLTRDPVLQNQHKYYALWLAASGYLLPLGIGFMIGRPLACLLFAGFTRGVFVWHCTFLINSWAHYFGRRPFSLDITARDSLICALFTYGEGWHNYHHKFPFDYRMGDRVYLWDPTKWFIGIAQFLGLAWDLKRTPPQEIYRARIQTQRQKLKVESAQLKSLAETMEGALQKWTALHLEWQRLRADVSKKSSVQIAAINEKLRQAKSEFQESYTLWKASLKQSQAFAA